MTFESLPFSCRVYLTILHVPVSGEGEMNLLLEQPWLKCAGQGQFEVLLWQSSSHSHGKCSVGGDENSDQGVLELLKKICERFLFNSSGLNSY